MRVGSLFSGIGGMDLGLERAGMEIVWQVEVDEWCRRVLARHFPDAVRYGDVRDCHGAAVADAASGDGINVSRIRRTLERQAGGRIARDGRLAPVDLICGGFPCQPVSHAGRRLGAEDDRWLWPEFYRIVREVRPRWVLVENVPGLRSIDDGRLFAGVLRDLAEGGYDAEWNGVSAASVGAPHIRDRVFIVAHATGADAGSGTGQQQGQEPPDREPPQLLPNASGGGGEAATGYVADAEGEQSRRLRFGWLQPDASTGSDKAAHASWWSAQCRLGIAAHRPAGGLDCGGWECGVPRTVKGQRERVARLRGEGNAVVPQVAEYVGRLIMEASRG